MEDKHMDDLFKKELEISQEFFNSNEQWEIVEKKLKTKRKNGFWFITALLVLSGLGLYNIDFISIDDASLIHEELAKNEVLSPIDKHELIASVIGDANFTELEKDPEKLSSEKLLDTKRNPINSKLKANRIVNNTTESNLNNSVKDKLLNKDVSVPDSRLKLESNLNDLTSQLNNEKCDDCVEHISKALLGMEAREQNSFNDEVINDNINLSKANINVPELEGQDNEKEEIALNPSFLRLLDYNQRIYQMENSKKNEANVKLINLKPKSKFSIFVGISNDYLRYSTAIDSSGLIAYIGVSYNFSKRFKFNVSYSQYDVNKTVTSDSLNYRIPKYNPIVYGTYSLDHININYFNQAIDWSLMFNFYKHPSVNLYFELGGQLNRLSQFSNDYLYKSEYDENLVTNKINDVSFNVSDLLFGVHMDFPIIYNISVTGGYKLYFPIHNQSFRWVNRHRASVGLNFNF